MDLNLLRSLTVFSEHLNLTHAARALHISQPALYTQLQRLSDQLGVTLYERRGRKLELTIPGQRVVGFARDLDGQVERLLDELHGRAHPQPVTLASGEGAFRYLLGDAIREFQARSSASLRLMTLRGEEMERAVRLGRVDLAVTASELSEPDEGGVERLTIRDIPMTVAMLKDHPLATREVISLGDLDGCSLIVPPVGRPHRLALDLALRSARVEWRVGVEAMGWELSLHFVALGLGLSVVNGFCEPPPGVTLRPLIGLPSRTYFLLQRRGAQRSPQAELLRELIVTMGSPEGLS